jgi:alpha-L-fucosidase 2
MVATHDGRLVVKGTSGNVDNKVGKVRFETIVVPKTEGGKVSMTDSTLTVQDANAATIYISIGSNFKNYRDISGNESEVANAHLKNIHNKDYKAVLREHIADYRSYFDRVSLDLGATDSIKNPTDRRVADFATANDPQLVSLYFQFGRYLLISSSRPGTQPANLQGIWNHKMNPPWDSKYTININTEMNYWPAEPTNLPEMHEPLFAMLNDLSVVGQETAREMYGREVGHCTTIPISGA